MANYPVDIQAYLSRINYQGSIEANIEILRAIHQAHLLAVPFENLDIHLGRPITLDTDRLYEKIVNFYRGGFCYELNGLFAALLHELGFNVQRLSARVANEQGGFGIPFDHMTLIVNLEQIWLVDVGFGDSFREPLLLNTDGVSIYNAVQEQPMGRYRISEEGESLIYWREEAEGWKPQYKFRVQPYDLADFQNGCDYHQTSPKSSFTQRRICSLATADGRISLSDMKLYITTNGKRVERDVRSEAEYSQLLKERFGVVL